jgi:hypothetical protein
MLRVAPAPFLPPRGRIYVSGCDFLLCKGGAALLEARPRERVFPGSSAVEQPAVNRLVAGSNPARGAKQNQ